MISSINIKNVASFDDVNGVEITDLKRVNFFFGFNGSGKSTIAKYIRNLALEPSEQNADFAQCSRVGYNSSQHEILTFNEGFIDENFIRNTELKGVFSLNQSNAAIDQQITDVEANIQLWEAEKTKYTEKSEALIIDDELKKQNLLNHCWNQRSTFTTFSRLALAHSGRRDNHLAELRGLLQNPLNNVLTIEELTQKYQNLYEKELIEITNSIDAKIYLKVRRLEVKIEKLLQEVIVGNEDVDIATLIKSLGSQSWVEQGLPYLETTGERCPFCQEQTINESLKEQFENLFDETYKNKTTTLESLRDEYKQNFGFILDQLSVLQDVFNPSNQVSNLILNLRTLIDQNIEIIDDKIGHANEKKSITSLSQHKIKLSSIIIGIKDNNELFGDVDTRRQELQNEIWKYIADKCKDELGYFDNRKSKSARVRTQANELKIRAEGKISASLQNIESLRRQTVNTSDAVNNINTILKNTGFEGFEIDEKDEVNNISRYYLKRPNNTNSDPIFNTLSEGEKNFISFLYFYQRCLGTDDLLNTGSKKKIIVIDDPVSSLDSQCLFLVSTLIHSLLLRKSDGPRSDKKLFKDGNIAQVFILTHNIYFYREVSFERRPICTDYWHFRIFKINNLTQITGDYKRSVYDDYSLMWQNLKETKANLPQDTSLNIMISNTMRRVIESYVNFIGYGRDSWASLFNEDPVESTYYIKSAFVSTINDESHGVKAMDSVYYQKIISEQPQILFDVFLSIFESIGKEHYELMMDERLN